MTTPRLSFDDAPRSGPWLLAVALLAPVLANACSASNSPAASTPNGDAGAGASDDGPGGGNTSPDAGMGAGMGADGSGPTSPSGSDASTSDSSFAWKPLRVGAGGFVRGMDVAPDGTMVARTDTYGAYLWNGTAWQQLVTATSMPAADLVPGNAATGVYEIRIAPSKTSTFYMAHLGNIYVSVDKGGTWTKTAFANVAADNANDSFGQYGQKMAVDPHNPDVVFAGTETNGLFVTKDGGNTWQSVAGVPMSQANASNAYQGITGIVFDPTTGTAGGSTSTLFASSFGNGVFKSTDGGDTWTALGGGPSDVEFAALSSTGVYYATGNGASSLWRYASGTWTQVVSSSDLGGNGAQAVAVEPQNPLHVVMATPGGTLNQSYDGGMTWSGTIWTASLTSTDVPWLAASSSPMGNDGGTTADQGFMDIGALAFDPLVANKLWASAGVGVWTTSPPPAMTYMVSWTDQSIGIEQLVANEIVVPPGGKPVLASWDRPFFYSANPDQYPTTYSPVNSSNIVAGWSIDYASSTPTFLVGIADWWGTEQTGYSTNGGQTWTKFASTMPSVGMGGTIAASTPMNIVWAPADNNPAYYTKDGGMTWSPVVLPGVSSWTGFDWAYYLDTRTVAADRVTPNTFYLFYAGNGLYTTTDSGDTWTQTLTGDIAPFDGYNAELEAVPGHAGHLFFTGGPQSGTPPGSEAFLRSTDGGMTWTPIPNLLQVYCFGFGAPKSAGGYPAIYVVGWVNNVYGVWRSDDEAATWSSLGTWPNNSLDSIKTIAGDPNTYGEVYVGFGGSGYAYYGP